MMLWLRAGSLIMFLAVALGAFGAHGLKNVLSDEMKVIFETAVRYQMIHGLALFLIAWLSTRGANPWVLAAGVFFLAGIVIFSGSLYVLALTGVRGWGAVTPVGGLCFLLGWLCLIFMPTSKIIP